MFANKNVTQSPTSFSDVAPTEPPQHPGNCPESKKLRTWIPFRGHCYSFLSAMQDNWAHATVECMKMGTLCRIPADALMNDDILCLCV